MANPTGVLARQVVRAWRYQMSWDEANPMTCREIADEFGVRIRQTAETKQLGPDVYELGATYFYKTNSALAAEFAELRGVARSLGAEVWGLDTEGKPVGHWRNADKRWDTRRSPDVRWHTVLIRITQEPPQFQVRHD